MGLSCWTPEPVNGCCCPRPVEGARASGARSVPPAHAEPCHGTATLVPTAQPPRLLLVWGSAAGPGLRRPAGGPAVQTPAAWRRQLRGACCCSIRCWDHCSSKLVLADFLPLLSHAAQARRVTDTDTSQLTHIAAMVLQQLSWDHARSSSSMLTSLHCPQRRLTGTRLKHSKTPTQVLSQELQSKRPHCLPP